ncbi:hypothetical protein A3Q56_03244 [Intoshia linei]|uniref:FYVE-type domain-containing protein n=1 Tax=Intoshia linei TaxID=1819745 RepID=A0A177B423_9BILA|nr:hypothetical protein A3Q56_03244 [Intoshia linei]
MREATKDNLRNEIIHGNYIFAIRESIKIVVSNVGHDNSNIEDCQSVIDIIEYIIMRSLKSTKSNEAMWQPFSEFLSRMCEDIDASCRKEAFEIVSILNDIDESIGIVEEPINNSNDRQETCLVSYLIDKSNLKSKSNSITGDTRLRLLFMQCIEKKWLSDLMLQIGKYNDISKKYFNANSFFFSRYYDEFCGNLISLNNIEFYFLSFNEKCSYVSMFHNSIRFNHILKGFNKFSIFCENLFEFNYTKLENLNLLLKKITLPINYLELMNRVGSLTMQKKIYQNLNLKNSDSNSEGVVEYNSDDVTKLKTRIMTLNNEKSTLKEQFKTLNEELTKIKNSKDKMSIELYNTKMGIIQKINSQDNLNKENCAVVDSVIENSKKGDRDTSYKATKAAISAYIEEIHIKDNLIDQLQESKSELLKEKQSTDRRLKVFDMVESNRTQLMEQVASLKNDKLKFQKELTIKLKTINNNKAKLKQLEENFENLELKLDYLSEKIKNNHTKFDEINQNRNKMMTAQKKRLICVINEKNKLEDVVIPQLKKTMNELGQHLAQVKLKYNLLSENNNIDTRKISGIDIKPSLTNSSHSQNLNCNVIKPKRKITQKKAEWVEDDLIDNCLYCDKKFTLVLRKHHCRKCGKVFCNDCSPYRFVSHNKSVRVCRACEPLMDSKVYQTVSEFDHKSPSHFEHLRDEMEKSNVKRMELETFNAQQKIRLQKYNQLIIKKENYINHIRNNANSKLDSISNQLNQNNIQHEFSNVQYEMKISSLQFDKNEKEEIIKNLNEKFDKINEEKLVYEESIIKITNNCNKLSNKIKIYQDVFIGLPLFLSIFNGKSITSNLSFFSPVQYNEQKMQLDTSLDLIKKLKNTIFELEKDKKIKINQLNQIKQENYQEKTKNLQQDKDKLEKMNEIIEITKKQNVVKTEKNKRLIISESYLKDNIRAEPAMLEDTENQFSKSLTLDLQNKIISLQRQRDDKYSKYESDAKESTIEKARIDKLLLHNKFDLLKLKKKTKTMEDDINSTKTNLISLASSLRIDNIPKNLEISTMSTYIECIREHYSIMQKRLEEKNMEIFKLKCDTESQYKRNDLLKSEINTKNRNIDSTKLTIVRYAKETKDSISKMQNYEEKFNQSNTECEQIRKEHSIIKNQLNESKNRIKDIQNNQIKINKLISTKMGEINVSFSEKGMDLYDKKYIFNYSNFVECFDNYITKIKNLLIQNQSYKEKIQSLNGLLKKKDEFLEKSSVEMSNRLNSHKKIIRENKNNRQIELEHLINKNQKEIDGYQANLKTINIEKEKLKKTLNISLKNQERLNNVKKSNESNIKSIENTNKSMVIIVGFLSYIIQSFLKQISIFSSTCAFPKKCLIQSSELTKDVNACIIAFGKKYKFHDGNNSIILPTKHATLFEKLISRKISIQIIRKFKIAVQVIICINRLGRMVSDKSKIEYKSKKLFRVQNGYIRLNKDGIQKDLISIPCNSSLIISNIEPIVKQLESRECNSNEIMNILIKFIETQIIPPNVHLTKYIRNDQTFLKILKESFATILEMQNIIRKLSEKLKFHEIDKQKLSKSKKQIKNYQTKINLLSKEVENCIPKIQTECLQRELEQAFERESKVQNLFKLENTKQNKLIENYEKCQQELQTCLNSNLILEKQVNKLKTDSENIRNKYHSLIESTNDIKIENEKFNSIHLTHRKFVIALGKYIEFVSQKTDQLAETNVTLVKDDIYTFKNVLLKLEVNSLENRFGLSSIGESEKLKLLGGKCQKLVSKFVSVLKPIIDKFQKLAIVQESNQQHIDELKSTLNEAMEFHVEKNIKETESIANAHFTKYNI